MTEVVVLSSSPPPFIESHISPRRCRLPIIIPSTSSPEPADVLGALLIPSRAIVGDQEEAEKASAILENEEMPRTPSKYGLSGDALNRPVEDVQCESPKSAESGFANAKGPVNRHRREDVSAQPSISATSIHLRNNRRGARRKPVEDEEFFLDKRHPLYFMHFQPQTSYKIAAPHVEHGLPDIIEALTFIEDKLSITARNVIRGSDITSGGNRQRTSPYFAQTEIATVKKKRTRPPGGRAKTDAGKAIDKLAKAAAREKAKEEKRLAKLAAKATARGKKSSTGGVNNAPDTARFEQPHAENSNKVIACKRKVDWTPPRDSFIEADTIEKSHTSRNSPKVVELSELLSKYVHEDIQRDVPSVGIVREPCSPLRKERVSKKDTPEEEASIQISALEKVNPPTAQKKKPKTITGMALEAYQPVIAAPEPDNRISHFFKACAKEAKSAKSAKSRSRSPQKAAIQGEDGKPKRPKKVRLATEDGKDMQSKPQKKSKKAEEIRPKLLSPLAATRRISRQDFLFGTSSQLARNEDPEELQEIQQALRESMTEAVNPVLNPLYSPVARRGVKGLWDVSKLDDIDASIRQELRTSSIIDEAKGHELPVSPAHAHEGEVEDLIEQQCSSSQVTLPLDEPYPTPDAQSSTTTPHLAADEAFVNIEDFSSPHIDRSVQPFRDQCEMSPAVERLGTLGGRSGSSGRAMYTSVFLDNPASFRISPTRPALRHLSTNASPRKQAKSLDKELISSEDDDKPLAEVRKRIRATPGSLVANIQSQSALLPAKRPRGRPRKDRLQELQSATQPTTEKDIRALRKVNRTAKQRQTSSEGLNEWTRIDEIEDSEPDLTPSPPRGSQTQQLPGFEAASPQRRGRKSSIPARDATPATAPAEEAPRSLSPRQVKAKAQRQAKVMEEQTWAAVSSVLFPQITETIRASKEPADPSGKYIPVPRRKKTMSGAQAAAVSSTAAGPCGAKIPIRLSWYEKILLYDPIVIEDLTDWLVGKGVHIPLIDGIDLMKPRNGSRGRSKTHIQEEKDTSKVKDNIPANTITGTADTSASTLPRNTNQENRPLEPWMVQRWCEDNSVCCLWRANLVGGARKRW